jgi:hypothetical protein
MWVLLTSNLAAGADAVLKGLQGNPKVFAGQDGRYRRLG